MTQMNRRKPSEVQLRGAEYSRQGIVSVGLVKQEGWSIYRMIIGHAQLYI